MTLDLPTNATLIPLTKPNDEGGVPGDGVFAFGVTVRYAGCELIKVGIVVESPVTTHL